jgi:hypothetical protein
MPRSHNSAAKSVLTAVEALGIGLIVLILIFQFRLLI